MLRAVSLILLMIFSAFAHGETLWKGTSVQSVIKGSGDVLDVGGATVSVSGTSTGESAFIGAITSLDAGSLKGREVRLTGRLRVDDGAGAAALWLRADGVKGKVAFATSASKPVHPGDGWLERELALYIPSTASSIKFGVTLRSSGQLQVQRLTLTSRLPEPTGVSAHDVMSQALTIIRARALNGANIDWAVSDAELVPAELKLLPSQEAYSRLNEVVATLSDRHSILQTPEVASAFQRRGIASRPIESRSMGSIGYLLVPGFRGSNPQDAAEFASELCSRISQLASASSKGWILDLRENTGGNMWPMLNGLYPLLGQENTGAFRDRNGVTSHWRSRSSPRCRMDLSKDPVAVLLGPRTASSGEAMAVAFRGRSQTRFFGRTTAGLATANGSFPLPDGGALRLTTAVMLDRDGTAYPEGIAPEEPVPEGRDAVAAAAAWLGLLP